MNTVPAGMRGADEGDARRTDEPELRLGEGAAEPETDTVELRRALEEAERANQRKTEFLSRLSHEVRTPLNAVLGLAQLLERRPLAPRECELAVEIVRGGRYLLNLVNDLLDVSRLESGRLNLSIEPVAVGALIREARDLVSPLATEHRVELCTEVPEPVPPLLADRQRLMQVLLNLLSNAVKFNCECGRVTVACAQEGGGRVAIHVTDTGPGIAPQDLERVFVPFERLGADATDVEGAGLGLTVAKSLAEAMGGTIEVRSRPGRGSTFSVLLPAAFPQPVYHQRRAPSRLVPMRGRTRAPVHALPEQGAFVPAVVNDRGKRPGVRPERLEVSAMKEDVIGEARVLVVDDEESNVRLLERILRRAGCVNVEGTTDPREVAPILSEFDPDLVLLDLHMPHLSGFEVMQQIESLVPADAYLPVLVLTADVTREAKWRALAAGARDYLTKPVDPTEVTLRVRNILETRFLHRQLSEQKALLEGRVAARTRDLEDARNEVLQRLALAAEFRDDETGRHTRRVGLMAASLAEALGLPETRVDLIGRTAPLHDVGKIGVPDAVLLKQGELTPREFERVLAHTTIGAEMLSGDGFPLLEVAQKIALTHHERWNGSGYPQGLRGDSIPLAGRIVAVADAFDAITHERPYRKARSVEEAVVELDSCRASHFDPEVVDAFQGLLGTEDFLERAMVG